MWQSAKCGWQKHAVICSSAAPDAAPAGHQTHTSATACPAVAPATPPHQSSPALQLRAPPPEQLARRQPAHGEDPMPLAPRQQSGLHVAAAAAVPALVPAQLRQQVAGPARTCGAHTSDYKRAFCMPRTNRTATLRHPPPTQRAAAGWTVCGKQSRPRRTSLRQKDSHLAECLDDLHVHLHASACLKPSPQLRPAGQIRFE